MSEREEGVRVAQAIGGDTPMLHHYREEPEGPIRAWAVEVVPRRQARAPVALILAGVPEHHWIIVLSVPLDHLRYGAGMAQAIARAPVEQIERGFVEADHRLWQPADSPLCYRYRLVPAHAELRAVYQHCLQARPEGPPAFLAETIAGVSRALARLQRLRALEAPPSVIDADRERAIIGLALLREHARDDAILDDFPEDLRPLVAELLPRAARMAATPRQVLLGFRRRTFDLGDIVAWAARRLDEPEVGGQTVLRGLVALEEPADPGEVEHRLVGMIPGAPAFHADELELADLARDLLAGRVDLEQFRAGVHRLDSKLLEVERPPWLRELHDLCDTWYGGPPRVEDRPELLAAVRRLAALLDDDASAGGRGGG
jgi:hypothetical protein